MTNWIDFFNQNNIPYRTSGPNVGRDALVTHCVWCGASDEGEHLVVSLKNKGYHCWRGGKAHSGKNDAKLIQALINCSWEQAQQLAGQGRVLPSDFMSRVKMSLSKQVVQKTNNLKLPEEFRKFSKLPSCQIYLNYINSRGFTIKDTEEYGVLFANHGLYRGRIIFPVVQDGELVGWTGRTVYSSEMARYKTLTDDPDKASENGEIPAPAPISDYLLFYDHLVSTDADTIVLVEGPFDTWKTNILGKHIGICSTCFFTSTLSKQQLNLLHGILPKFKNRILLLDQGTFTKASRMKSDMIALDVQVKKMSDGIKDPALVKTPLQLKSMLAIV
jgi:hypothetical protein